jgi:phage terminase large subunit GpA-like protein
VADGAQVYEQAFIQTIQPPLDLTVSEWADLPVDGTPGGRMLTRRSTSEPGQWRTDRVPFLREPMDLLSPKEKRIKRVILIFGSQSGAKTECGLNWLGRTIAMDPAPFLIVFPTESFAKRQYRQRIDPLFRDTPSVAAKQLSAKSRDSANSMFLKEFEGDMLVSIIGGNSGSAAQGMPAQYLWVDEASSLPQEIDDKGDPIENAEARQTNFPDRKTLLTSTPGTRGACRITWEFEQRSDMRRYGALMPCCGAHAVLRWEHMVWDRPDGDVWCQCPACGERVGQHHKPTMLAGGIWTPTAAGDGETAGFHLPGWYAPYGWLSWEKIRDEFERARHDRLLLKGWVNKRAAEAWEDKIEAAINAEALEQRRNDLESGNGYALGTIPAGVLIITMGVDVQGGGGSIGQRLAIQLWGWGRGEEAWHLGSFDIDGDPQQDAVWAQLDLLRATRFRRTDGVELPIFQGAIDDGGSATHTARNYCRDRRGLILVKGSSTKGRPIIGRGTPVDIDYNNQLIKHGVMLYIVGTDTSISLLQGRLAKQKPGPGYMHFGDSTCSSDQFIRELFPWKQRLVKIKGFDVSEWFKPNGERFEAGDCTRYAYAALQLVISQHNRATFWQQLEAQLGSGSAPQPAAPVKPRRARENSFLGGSGGLGRGKGNWLGRSR